MASEPDVSLSKFELEIMEMLWRLGEATVRDVHEALQERRRPAYTTVQTIFSRLEEKGAVRRTRKIGNAFLFAPTVTRKSTHRRLVDDFLDLFGGSAQPVLSRLVETGKLTLEDLRALEEAEDAGAPSRGDGKAGS